MNILTNPKGIKRIVLQKENSEEKIILEDFTNESSELDLEIVVQGKNIKVEVIGLAESSESVKKKWKVFLKLEGENQVGILDLKGVADQKGFLEFDGGGVIGRDSINANITVNEKILLFSKTASAKAIPVLRVETQDLNAASHSANIAPFDEEMFFYLESRGIPKDEGKRLLKEGMMNIPE